MLQKQELFKGLLLSGLALKPDPELIGPVSVSIIVHLVANDRI